MFLIPKGAPLAENVPTSRIDLPSVLGKLRSSNFSGYAQLGSLSVAGVLLYCNGRMISAVFQRNGNKCLLDLDAIQATMESLVLNGNGTFSAYRCTRDIIFALLALFKGNVILNAQEMRLIDFRGVLEMLRAERMYACLKVYTDERAGVIMYHDGKPVGFFHDAAREIGASQDEVQKIAGLPGAKIDVQVIKESEDTATLVDLNDLIDIEKAWTVAKENVFATGAGLITSPPAPPPASSPTPKLTEIKTALIEIAGAHLGKLGRTLAEKELAKTGDPHNLLVPEHMESLLTSLEKGSKLLTSSLKIRQMQDAMRAEIARYS